MRKITTIICLLILIAAFAFMFVFSVFLPRTTESNYSILTEPPVFTFESLFSGKFFKDAMSYFTDTIHSRDAFIDFETRISSLYGMPEGDKVIELAPEEDEASDSTANDISDVSNTTTVESDYSTTTSIEEDTVSQEIPGNTSEPIYNPSENENEKNNIELSGSVYILGTRGLEIYYGSEAKAAQYADIINNFANIVDNNVNIYSMVIPKSSAYYLGQASEEKYSKLALRNKRDIDIISNNLSDQVIDVNIYNTLGLHANEEIYFRTDHHWTGLGAYYASQVFTKSAGVSMDDLSEFRESRRNGFLGSYYWVYSSKDNNSVLLNNPEDMLVYYPDADYSVTYYSASDLSSNPRENENGFFWDKPDSQKSAWYSTYLNGDAYSIKAVSNDCKNGRKLLIVKDSYGNALAPYMVEGFEEVYIVDARKYKQNLNDTIEKFGITDVLFAECTFSAVSSDYLTCLKELCK